MRTRLLFPLTVTEVTAILSLTVTAQLALLPPTVAVTVVLPGATAVTSPVWLTVAAAGLLLLQTGAALGVTVALSCTVYGEP